MRLTTIILLAVLVVGLSILDTTMVRLRPPSRYQDSAAVALAGEFRVVFANLLWAKLENYHEEYSRHHKDWTKNTDAMGLNRLITKLDPHFEEAYANGTWMLIGQGKPREAYKYLDEGLTNNPNSVLLHDEMGTVLAVHLKDYKQALFHFKRAYVLSKDDWDRQRLAKLIKTVEGISKPQSSAKAPT